MYCNNLGFPPHALRGTKTGVYIGHNCIGMPDHFPQELQLDSRSSFMETSLWIAGTGKNMYANRLSFAFDLRGPSLVIDTACSSSLVAFDVAVTDIRLGKCDQAIVGTTQIDLQPFTNFIFQNCHFNAPDGISKVWDKDANGFVRAETVSCVFLQRKSNAKRIYATVIHTKTNIDGYKKSGNFFPSKEGQQELLEETCIEAGIDPKDINYFEAHGTGTKVGDPQEAKAIAGAYCKNRKDELLVGLLKSNIGHGEGTSGLASVCKALISFENECIAANLNLKELKQEIAGYCPPLKHVGVNTPFEPKVVGINSFGLGGVNAHAILRANPKKKLAEDFEIVPANIPRIVNLCGRTEEGLNHLFDFIQNNPNKVTKDFLALLNDSVKLKPQLNSAGFPYRGTLMIKNKIGEDGKKTFEYSRESGLTVGMNKPVWFFFSGMGSQWVGMGKSLMVIDKFAESIHRCAEVVKPFKIDLLHVLLSDDKEALSTIVNPFVAITACQIALFDLLTELEIKPDGIIGHSFGEIACAYADGCLTLEQTMLCSYWRGKVVEDGNIPSGKMAAVGLSWEEANRRAPRNVYVACDNAPDSVTISGLEDDVKPFLERLKNENVFVRDIVGFSLKPYHTTFLTPLVDVLTKILKKVIPSPKPRSRKWWTTSVPYLKWEEEGLYASAEYFVNNLIKPVLFTQTLRFAPPDAIIVEVAPHALFSSLVKRTVESINYVGLLKRNSHENLDIFLNAIGKMYQLGVNPAIERLYPKVEWPVARGTQSISSLIKWDHSETYFIKKYPEYYFPATSSDMTFRFSFENDDDTFLKDHCVEGKVIFPAAGYLMLAWRRLAAQKGQQWNKFPIVFENVQLRRPVMFDKGKVKLTVRYLEPSGEFLVLEGGNIACYGKCYVPEPDTALQLQHLAKEKDEEEQPIDDDSDEYTLDASEFYRELRIRGYDYGPKFQGVVESKYIDISKAEGKVKWSNNSNFTVFLDSMLQLLISVIPIRALFIPVSIQSIRCDPQLLFDAIGEYKTEIYEDVQKVNKADFDETISEITATDPKGPDAEELEKQEQEKLKEKNETEFVKYKGQITELKEEIHEYKRELEVAYAEFQDRTGSGRQKWVSHLPVFVDLALRTIVCKGIEVRGIVPVNIPRKHLSNGLRLEKYEFVPNFQENAIENVTKRELKAYTEACTSLCLKIIKNMKMDHLEPLLTSAKNLSIDDQTVQDMVISNRDEHVLLKIFSNFLKSQKDSNDNLLDKEEMQAVFNKLKEEVKTKPELDVTKDALNLVGRNEKLVRPLLDMVNENSERIKELKCLEMNTSNAIVGLDIGQVQTETFVVPVALDYTIAHQAPELLENNKELKTSEFKILKWTPSEQVFPSNINGFNLVIHRDTFDLWKLDLNEYISSVYNCINTNGFLLALFKTKVTQPEHIYSYLFENEKLPSEAQLSERIKTFESAALEKGFNMISKRTDSFLNTAILLRKVNKDSINLKGQAIVEIKTGKFEEWVEELKDKIAVYKTKPANENIWLVANDSNVNGVTGLIQSLRLESGGEKLRCIYDLEGKLPKPVDFTKSPYNDILANNLVMNMYKGNKFGAMRHLYLTEDDDHIETSEAYVNVMQRGDLSSLQWFDAKNLQVPFIVSKELKTTIKRTQSDIYYSALNFKDVMMAIGRISPGPEGALIDCLIGFEFAGRDRETKERVFGMGLSFNIATVATTNSPLLWRIPDEWSMEDAATITAVYMTVWYGIIERGYLQPGESILIHSGSGGVGQAALNVCKHLGCKIFTTVGTKEKREFLKQTYGLTDSQIFSSRNTDFEEKIFQATKGKGVDMVLNSLSEEKLLASFRCVGDDGRFIEIGKYDLQMNNPLPMFAFIKNISFHGVALDKLSLLEKKYQLEIIAKFKDWMYKGVKEGYVKPLPRTVFGPHQVKEAFKHMMTGKHIGKVLVKIRDEESDRLKPTIPKPVTIRATTKTWFRPDRVYILVGGLGGMGVEMIYWMMLRGAKKIVATSRSGVKTNSQRLFLKQLAEFSKWQDALNMDVTVSTENAVTMEGAEALIKQAEALAPIGGIFNLALVLHDALIENQNPDTFRMVCEPKYDLTYNLDQVTRKLKYPLEYFVTFSSITSGRGHTYQSNYGYANSMMERVCENRRRDGLHGLSIQWGPIGDVGVLADMYDEDRVKLAGMLLQRLPSWLYALDKFLQCPHAVVASAIRMDKQLKTGSSEENMMKQLWSALGIDPKTIPNHVTLGELGMESFVAVELQQRLERDYDISLSLNEIRKITIGDLKLFQGGNKEKLKQYAADIKIARTNLSKIRFDIATEPVTKLNNITTGSPVYFLPPIEGIFDNLHEVISKLNNPVFGLNWTKEMDQNIKSIKEAAMYYIKLLKTLEPKGNYILGTFSFGTAVGIKMCYKKAPVKKMFIIDAFSSEKVVTDFELLENEEVSSFEQILRFIDRNVPKSFHARIKNDVVTAKNQDERVQRVITELRDFGDRSINGRDLDRIIKGSVEKGFMLTAFRRKIIKKLKGVGGTVQKKVADNRVNCEVIIIKATDNPEDTEVLDEETRMSYGLSKEVIKVKN